jgi:hypothetical protein
MATQAGDARKFVTFWCALDAGFGGCCIARPSRNRLMQQCPFQKEQTMTTSSSDHSAATFADQSVAGSTAVPAAALE